MFVFIHVTGTSILTIECAILMMAFTVPGVLTLSKSSFSFNPKDSDVLSKVSNQVSLLDVIVIAHVCESLLA